jgi:hypothetical protein
MPLLCSLFGHKRVHGYMWYPWGVASWWAYDVPKCERCGIPMPV